MGEKSRFCFPNPGVCFRGDCIFHNTDECKNCINFHMYTTKNDENDLKYGHERFTHEEEKAEQIRESDHKKRARKRSAEQDNKL